jgi:hypothetical protein
MGPFLTAVLAWFAGVFARIGGWMTLNYWAQSWSWRALRGGLAILVNNVLLEVFGEIFYWWLGMVSGMRGARRYAEVNTDGGGGGYLFVKMGLGEALVIVLNAAAYRFALTMIPFVGPK